MRAPQVVLEVGAAAAEQDELRALAHEPLEVVADEVHALLVVQPPYEAQQRRARVLRQAQLLQTSYIRHLPNQACLLCLPQQFQVTSDKKHELWKPSRQGRPSSCAVTTLTLGRGAVIQRNLHCTSRVTMP